jgi:cysteine desulfurase
MSEKQKRRVEQNKGGYQAKIDRLPGKPPTGGSNVKPPPRFFCYGCKNSCRLAVDLPPIRD